MSVARSSFVTSAARRRTASGSLARASRPFARSSSRGIVPAGAGASKLTTWRRHGSLSRTSATFAACAGVETKATFASESWRMYCTCGGVSVE